jgi:hypothetical protein
MLCYILTIDSPVVCWTRKGIMLKFGLCVVLGVLVGIYGVSGVLGIGKSVVSTTAKVGTNIVSGVAK